jgi:hypothetical protein
MSRRRQQVLLCLLLRSLLLCLVADCLAFCVLLGSDCAASYGAAPGQQPAQSETTSARFGQSSDDTRDRDRIGSDFRVRLLQSGQGRSEDPACG